MTFNSSNLVDTIPNSLINFSVYKNSQKKNAKFCKKIPSQVIGIAEYIDLHECDGCHKVLLFERGFIRHPYFKNENGFHKLVINDKTQMFTNTYVCRYKYHPTFYFCYHCYRKHMKNHYMWRF